MNCKYCGGNVTKNHKFCPNCGANLTEEPSETKEKLEENQIVEPKETTEKKKVSGFSIAGMVLGIVSLCSLDSGVCLVLSVLGIIFSSLGSAKYASGEYKGKGFHVAGLITSIVALSIFVLILIGRFTSFIINFTL